MGISNNYRQVILADAYEWLAEVKHTKDLSLKNDEHRKQAELMLLNRAVLRYMNDKLWFALHPSVAEIPGVKEAYDRLVSASKHIVD